MDGLEQRVQKIEANYANRVYLTVLCCIQALLSICLWISNGNHRPIIPTEASHPAMIETQHKPIQPK